ncbi:biotin-dependent carboxyltransferase family protein [Pseudomonas tolaasii]|uniref:Biotin-dependent carboxyltransferase family protein n=2 Tax=Pseudomonas tolaasii TaxID=29442 RepID=A0A7Y8AWY5_PSETO|nr:biotin-dependent carboxyltransferase family protein [Pseudomonas tolaasii]ARB27392.1 allophanate hydrolase [Pseudomonas tolaasii]KAB0467501.1 biotin-dependent carboxyltransferase family protein [Pseudomonas tolaasii]MBW1250782.1 biotin-dependent carboxyltransferase family protein [Pseudomonas tolaasii]MBY8943288.1 biotin-dependent carboxyltransferase family protein [Pseudomonas tolaasii]NVZ48449.1 biotin-dependent carboxyltransferase family protein [Pseudomonas tolaasii]
MIRILSSGALNLVQDLGRHGTLNLGVSRSGAMDREALSLANLLVGNSANAAGIEVSVFPFRLRFETDRALACTGAQCQLTLDGCRVPGWSAVNAKAGQTLVIQAPTLGVRAYLAFSGGLATPVVMGSRATDLKAGFGGHEGRGLKRDDCLDLLEADACPANSRAVAPSHRAAFFRELASGCISVRVLPAAEHAQFSAQALQAFYHMSFQVTLQSNRVGYRLEGQPLLRREPVELLSHGIAPGTVQVPPDGQPIIQLAEANTCGGYPKIATVLETDLWRLAQAPVGCAIRFTAVTPDAAVDEHRRHCRALATLAARLRGQAHDLPQ